MIIFKRAKLFSFCPKTEETSNFQTIFQTDNLVKSKIKTLQIQ